MNRKAVKFFFVLIFVMICGFCFAADPAEGFWISVDEKTSKDTGGWQIYVQDGKLYGKSLSGAGKTASDKAVKCNDSYRGFPANGKVSELPIIGTVWIFGLVPASGQGQWKGGNIIDAGDGRMYGCEITFHAADGNKYEVDTLEMRGKIGPFGRSQFWRKATETEARGLR